MHDLSSEQCPSMTGKCATNSKLNYWKVWFGRRTASQYTIKPFYTLTKRIIGTYDLGTERRPKYKLKILSWNPKHLRQCVRMRAHLRYKRSLQAGRTARLKRRTLRQTSSKPSDHRLIVSRQTRESDNSKADTRMCSKFCSFTIPSVAYGNRCIFCLHVNFVCMMTISLCLNNVNLLCRSGISFQDPRTNIFNLQLSASR